MKERYYVVPLVIEGHGENSNRTFVSIENSAEQLISLIDRKYRRQVFALIGLSLGAQIIIEALSLRKEITKYAVVESVSVCPMKLVKLISSPMINYTYWLIKQRWFSNIQVKALFIPKSNTDYKLKDSIRETKAKTLIIAGEKEIGKNNQQGNSWLIQNRELKFESINQQADKWHITDANFS